MLRDASDGPVDLAGFSPGAVVAASVAAQHPELVRRLVLIAGWQDSTDPRHRLTFELWRRLADLDGRASAQMITLLLFTPGFLSRMGAGALEESVAGTVCSDGTNRQIDLGLTADISALTPKITAPTLSEKFMSNDFEAIAAACRSAQTSSCKRREPRTRSPRRHGCWPSTTWSAVP